MEDCALAEACGELGSTLGNKEIFQQRDDGFDSRRIWETCGGLFGIKGTIPRLVIALQTHEIAKPLHNFGINRIVRMANQE